MRNVCASLMIGLAIFLTPSCSEGESQADSSPRASSPGASTVGNATTIEGSAASGGTPVVDAAQAELSGGRVETCDGGSIHLNAYEKRTVELHNQIREDRGLEQLCVNPALTEAARAHSKEMIVEDYFAHTSPGGETLGDRLRHFGYVAEGYEYWKWGGNIAWHSDAGVAPEVLFEGWMNSPGHRENILDEEFRQIGLGTYTGKYENYENSIMYTANFGVRRR